jgi:hypothetical protein
MESGQIMSISKSGHIYPVNIHVVSQPVLDSWL